MPKLAYMSRVERLYYFVYMELHNGGIRNMVKKIENTLLCIFFFFLSWYTNILIILRITIWHDLKVKATEKFSVVHMHDFRQPVFL